MEFNIRQNANGSYISILTNNFEEGIKFFKDNNLEQIQLKGAITDIIHNIDFKLFESISNQLKTLSISDFNSKVSVIQNIDSLYKLSGLENLFINQKLDFNIDLSLFENLTQVGLIFSPKITNLNIAQKIDTLVITGGYNNEDLTFLTGLESLKILHIYKSSKLNNLTGIENFKKLDFFKVAFSGKLENIESINQSSIVKFHVEKCKNLTDFSVLKNNNQIKELFITELESLEFVKQMNSLEKIHFWNCKDGDLNPLLNSPSLKTAIITSNKKHYSHSQAEIDNYLKSK